MKLNEEQGAGRWNSSRRILLVMFLLLFAGLLGIGGWFVQFASQLAPGESSDTATVVVPVGSSVQEINAILADAGLVALDVRFPMLARYLGLASRLQAGEFALHRGQTPQELLKELASARSIQHSVTIPEGLTVVEIARVFSQKGWADGKEFVRLAQDPEFINSVGLGARKSLEGYLYPDTYYLTRKGQTTADILRMQVRHFFLVWENLDTTDIPLDLTPYEVLILASMVEKETARQSERPIIAGVFLNRLKKGMRLQSDPTVMYGIDDFSGRLRRKDLRNPSPYNTYTLRRLPIGPISNPGRAALKAVLHPTPSDLLYFVSKNDGSHKFSTTLREHNRAVNKYQRSKKR